MASPWRSEVKTEVILRLSLFQSFFARQSNRLGRQIVWVKKTDYRQAGLASLWLIGP
jgi:hypothetical protein